MDYIRNNYGTFLPKQVQDNKIALDAQWYLTTPITVLLTCIENCKLFSAAAEEPLTQKKDNFLCIP